LINYYSYVVFDIIFFYFGCSIASLFRALGQVIRARKELNSTLSKKIVAKFNIQTNPIYQHVKVVVNQVIKRSIS
jgi:hypothetical protein